MEFAARYTELRTFAANFFTLYSSSRARGRAWDCSRLRRRSEFKAPPHVVNRSAKSELWLAEFTDPDGNQLALMSEVLLSKA
jgi:hypothetical protein